MLRIIPAIPGKVKLHWPINLDINAITPQNIVEKTTNANEVTKPKPR